MLREIRGDDQDAHQQRFDTSRRRLIADIHVPLDRGTQPTILQHPVSGVGVPRPTRSDLPLVTKRVSREKSALTLDGRQAANTIIADTSQRSALSDGSCGFRFRAKQPSCLRSHPDLGSTFCRDPELFRCLGIFFPKRSSWSRIAIF
ncbi:MAG: hypothetical protein FD138_2380 [Planctomycetota bacterium]|nr:MAG: hypothetical protein FD138_2380 [Planctomycetota bacterium]